MDQKEIVVLDIYQLKDDCYKILVTHTKECYYNTYHHRDEVDSYIASLENHYKTIINERGKILECYLPVEAK